MIFILLTFTILLYHILKKSSLFLRKFLFFENAVLIFVSSLKHTNIGSDTERYLYLLEKSKNDSIISRITNFIPGYISIDYTNRDPGYAIIEKIISMVSTDSFFFFLVIALITLLPFASFNREYFKDKKQLLFSYILFIFFLFSNFPNQFARQCCAFGFICYGYKYFKHCDITKSLLMVFLASTFHKSALIVIPMFLMYKYIQPKYYLWIGLCGFAAVSLVPQLLFTLLGDVATIYANYFEPKDHYSVIIVYFLVALYILYFYPILSKKIDANEYRLELCGATWSFMLCPMIYIDPSVFRIISYFLIWNGILLPLVIDKYKQKLIIFFTIYLLFLFKSLPTDGIKWFYWQDVPKNEIILRD